MQKRFTKIPLPQAVIFYCQQYNIRNIVISAGSRNAPLTNGFVENPFFKTYSIVDERAAGFFALGLAQQLKKPVVIVCTSGSALLNYYPAVAEAYYSEIPIVIISADRMPHRIGIGDGQTIKQEGVFGPHLMTSAKLLADVSHATNTLLKSNKQTYFKKQPSVAEVQQLQDVHQNHNISELQRVFRLVLEKNGPIHLNVPMEEPLYEMSEEPISFPIPPQQKNKFDKIINTQLIESIWKNAKHKMILLGVSSPDNELSKVLTKLISDPSVLILTEKTSNFSHPHAINSIDCLMAPLELDKEKESHLRPDLLITIGGMIISKKIKSFLRNHKAKYHYHIGKTFANDTFFYLSDHINEPASKVLNTLKFNKELKSKYQKTNLNNYNKYLKKGSAYLRKIPFCDLKAFSLITASIPNDIHLQIANSSPIRYIQLFDLPKNVEVFSNRGTAGIDGSTATAVGASQINTKQTLLITGDLSFFYDINGLWNNYIPNDLRIIIINNQGGGIFRILPGEKDTPKYNTYFETIHNRNAKNIAKSFGLRYRCVKTIWGAKKALRTFYKPSKNAKILEICTPRKRNEKILLNYFSTMVKNN